MQISKNTLNLIAKKLNTFDNIEDYGSSIEPLNYELIRKIRFKTYNKDSSTSIIILGKYAYEEFIANTQFWQFVDLEQERERVKSGIVGYCLGQTFLTDAYSIKELLNPNMVFYITLDSKDNIIRAMYCYIAPSAMEIPDDHVKVSVPIYFKNGKPYYNKSDSKSNAVPDYYIEATLKIPTHEAAPIIQSSIVTP